MERLVEPEILEALSTHDPRAARSRRDLHRLHRMAFIEKVWLEWLRGLGSDFVPKRLVELGAGDGLLMLSLARSMSAKWPGVELVLLDHEPAVAESTCEEIRKLGWKVSVVNADAFCWLNKQGQPMADLVVANRFLHHFTAEELDFLMVLIAARTRTFFACEPRRSMIQMIAARLYSWMGCNAVTRHDLIRCVQSGFQGGEVSQHWPCHVSWNIKERSAGLCCHVFVASRAVTNADIPSATRTESQRKNESGASSRRFSTLPNHQQCSDRQQGTDQNRCQNRHGRF